MKDIIQRTAKKVINNQRIDDQNKRMSAQQVYQTTDSFLKPDISN